MFKRRLQALGYLEWDKVNINGSYLTSASTRNFNILILSLIKSNIFEIMFVKRVTSRRMSIFLEYFRICLIIA